MRVTEDVAESAEKVNLLLTELLQWKQAVLSTAGDGFASLPCLNGLPCCSSTVPSHVLQVDRGKQSPS